jgi:hypothetical protein
LPVKVGAAESKDVDAAEVIEQRKQEDSVGLPGESAELSDFTIAAQQSMSIAPGS